MQRLVVALALALAPVTATAAPVLIEGMPHVEQRPDFCGEACLSMAMKRLGHDVSQDAIFGLTGVDPALGRGAWTREMVVAAKALGFDIGPVWSTVRAEEPGDLDAAFGALVADLERGVPSIVCTRFDARPNTTEHFRLVTGYDDRTDEVITHDPAIRKGAYLRMKRATFLSLWPLKYDPDAWTLVRLRLDPIDVRRPPKEAAPTAAALAQHVRALREGLPPGFTVVVQAPFVVIGDEAPATVRSRAEKTVGWAMQRLEALFFDKQPSEILNVWLFKDAASYEHHARTLLGDVPGTPYGYYSPRLRALVMNIGTGGGTLVHEIVHPYMRANYPSCPAWINEGLGSLFEQSAERNGRIVGLTNWRLAGLQRAIRAGGVPTFRRLTSTSDATFYGDDSGVHYAQARYLMLWLQEQGLLERFVRGAMAARAQDPSGWRTLQLVLGEDDMAAFQRRWETWVLGLRFP